MIHRNVLGKNPPTRVRATTFTLKQRVLQTPFCLFTSHSRNCQPAHASRGQLDLSHVCDSYDSQWGKRRGVGHVCCPQQRTRQFD